MLDAGSFECACESHCQFILEELTEMTSKEGGHLFGFDRVDCRAHQFLIEGRQILLTMKDDVRGIFHLHQAPVIEGRKVTDDRTQFSGEAVQMTMKVLGRKGVGQILGFFPSVQSRSGRYPVG